MRSPSVRRERQRVLALGVGASGSEAVERVAQDRPRRAAGASSSADRPATGDEASRRRLTNTSAEPGLPRGPARSRPARPSSRRSVPDDPRGVERLAPAPPSRGPSRSSSGPSRPASASRSCRLSACFGTELKVRTESATEGSRTAPTKIEIELAASNPVSPRPVPTGSSSLGNVPPRPRRRCQAVQRSVKRCYWR